MEDDLNLNAVDAYNDQASAFGDDSVTVFHQQYSFNIIFFVPLPNNCLVI